MEILRIAVTIIAIFLACSFISTLFIYQKLFRKRIADGGQQDTEVVLKSEKVSFTSGANQLQGYFYYKDVKLDANRPIVLVVPGYGTTHKGYLLEIERFVNENYTVFSYDMTGSGESQGKSMKGFGQFILDAEAALRYLQSENAVGDIMIYAHSTGAFAAATLLGYVEKQVSRAVLVSGFDDSPSFVRMTMKRYLKFFAYPMQFWLYCFEYIQFGKKALSKGTNGVNHFGRTIVIVQGEKDQMVCMKNSLYARKKYITNPKAVFILVENANHNPVRTKENGKQVINEGAFQNILKCVENRSG